MGNTSESDVSKQLSWPWPYRCNLRPRKLSFRIHDDIFKAINSAYIIDAASAVTSPSPSSSPPPSAADATPDVYIESVIRSARSDRIFFDPGATSCSILDEASSSSSRMPSPYSDSVFLSVDSRDPVLDFRTSMEEMVAAHGLKDWDGLEELLQWYLKVNDEANHSYIYDAFLDLLVTRALVSADSQPGNGPPCRRNDSPSSPFSLDTSSSSSLSTRCVSGVETEDYDKEQCSVTLSSSS